MPSVNRTALVRCMLLAGALIVWGCGNPTSTATYDPEEAVHPVDWLPAGHVAPALENVNACTSCHGSDLSGGIVKVSCSECHLVGTIPTPSGAPLPPQVHPATFNGVPWLTGGHGQYVAQNGTSTCRNQFCHGSNLQGVPNSGPSCTECHSFP